MIRANFMSIVSILLDLAAIAAIICGFSMIWSPLGFIVGGLGLYLVSRAIDPPAPSIPEETGETWV